MNFLFTISGVLASEIKADYPFISRLHPKLYLGAFIISCFKDEIGRASCRERVFLTV